MSITSYSELQTAAANWAGRADLTNRIVEFITLAEAKMNRRLREKDMMTRDTAFPIGAEFVQTPANFAGVKSFWLNVSPIVVLDFMPDQFMVTKYQDGATGQPRHYNITGSMFHFGPAPDASYTATLIYYLKVPALTTTLTTNWMLANHPDAYVYGVMAELCAYLRDKEGASGWAQAMYQVLDEIKTASNRDRYSGDGAVFARPG